MSQQLHPADKPLLRLGAYLGGFVAFFAFAVLGLLIAKAPIRSEEPSFSEKTAQARKDVAEKISVAEAEALSVPAVDEATGVARLPIIAAKEVVLEDLKKLKAKKSAIPLPGSEAATKLMQQQSAPPAEEKKAAPKGKPKPQASNAKKANAGKKPQPKKSVPAETQKKPAAKPETPAKPSNPQG